MEKRKLKRSAIAVGMMSILMLSITVFCGGATTETAITDLADRTVRVQLPVERIVLGSGRYLHEFAAVGGEAVLDKIVGWGSDLDLYDKDTLDMYRETFPNQIAAITDIGYSSTFDAEAVIALEPDVVVFPYWSATDEGLLADIDKLERAGIPSVFLDYWSDPYLNPIESTLLIGTLLGEEERAQEVVVYYQQQMDAVTTVLATIETEKPKVYVEVGSTGPSEYGSTYGDSGLGAVVVKAGGINIAEDDLSRLAANTKMIDPEYLIATDPDVIIISGSKWTAADSMRLGYYAEGESSRALLEAFTQRTGWNTLTAVQQGRVYSSFHGFSFRIFNFVGVQAFAKWIYPEQFTNLDPEANFREFHERFLPVEYSGVWMIGLSSEDE